MHISKLQPDTENANQGTERGDDALDKSISQYGLGRSILLDRNNRIIAGNKTAAKAGELGLENVVVVDSTGSDLVAVRRTDLDLTKDSEARELAYADNRIGELSLNWDPAQMLEDIEEGISMPFFSETELDVIFENDTPDPNAVPSEPVASGVLVEKYTVPPFTVLDARQGYWQDRKRFWIDEVGISSEQGRGGNAVPGGTAWPKGWDADGNMVRGNYSKENTLGAIPSNQDDLLSPDYGKAKAFKGQDSLDKIAGNAESRTGTSIFDPVLAEIMYRWFSPEGGLILDPFAGGSVRGIVAERIGRKYLGIDLSQEQIDANLQQATVICDEMPEWVCGNSKDILPQTTIEPDMLFSCPPYHNLEVYSDDPVDLSNLSWEDFLLEYRAIIKAGCDLLKPDAYAAFVVGDLRGPDGNYRNFPGETINAFLDAGMALYNEAILVTAVGSLPIRVGKTFDASKKLGKTHQNVLIFRK